jgi:hypothetical protein
LWAVREAAGEGRQQQQCRVRRREAIFKGRRPRESDQWLGLGPRRRAQVYSWTHHRMRPTAITQLAPG